MSSWSKGFVTRECSPVINIRESNNRKLKCWCKGGGSYTSYNGMDCHWL